MNAVLLNCWIELGADFSPLNIQKRQLRNIAWSFGVGSENATDQPL